MRKIIIILLSTLLLIHLEAQSLRTITGKVFDGLSKEPLSGASITDNQQHMTVTDAAGRFSIVTADNSLTINFTGFQQQTISFAHSTEISISLKALSFNLEQVVVSANRTAQKRSEAPIAIATISQQTIEDNKANRIDHLVNKVSGVFMVNLGNEQHEMSIRQPMTTRSLFLYLEDGVPIRTTGIYNHNALLEMNLAATKQIEIIKGPASSLYGAEAIGGAVNIITQAPPAIGSGMLSEQANNNGYKRVDAQAGNTYGKLGLLVSGYYANRTDGPVAQTNFHKSAFTVRGDYKFNSKTTLSNSITYVDYYSDMGGGSLDSTKFAQKNYSTLYTFNYRTVTALRIKSQLSHKWNSNSETQVSVAYRDNAVIQNPSYYVTNNFANPALANGQINNSSFKSYMFIAQQVQKFKWAQSKLIAGVSADISPSTYYAKYIRIQRNAAGSYVSFTNTDSTLSNYSTGINNLAGYVNYEMNVAKGLKISCWGSL